MDDATLQALQSNYSKMAGGLQMPQQQQKAVEQPKKRSGWMNLIPVATSVLGGIAGTFAAPGIGTAAGGAAGGALGEWLTQKLSGEKSNTGKILTEGAFGALGGIGKGAQAIKGATTAVRAGQGAAAAGKVLRYGAPVASAVAKEGAETAAKGGIRGWMGNKLLGAADDTALRASQLSGKKEALKGFDKRFGEDLGTYLRKNNLIGKTGKDVEEGVIKGLNKEYTDIVAKIKTPITSSDVLAQNMKPNSSLSKLLKSGSTENKKLADDVFAELDTIFKEGGAKGLSAKRVAELKSEYQTLAKNAYKLGANTKASVNEKVAEYLKKTLQGVSGSDDLARTGKDIDKAYKAADLLASAAQNGRGTLSLGLTDLLAAGGGGVLGSVPGAVAAVGAKRAINSPKVQSFIANKLASTGSKMMGQAAPKVAKEVVAPTAMGTAKGMLKAQAAPRIIAGAAGGSMPQPEVDPAAMEMNPNSPFNPSSPNYNPALVDPNAVGDPNDLSSIMGAQESQYSLQAMQADIMRDPKNADQYAKIYELMNPEPAGGGDLSQTSRSGLASSDNAINTLDQLEQLFTAAGSGSGRIGGKLKGLAASAGFDENARVYNNLSQASVTQFAKALAGAGSGTVSDMDAKVILAAIPTISDTKAEAAAKFKALRQRLENAKINTLQYGSGSGTDNMSDLQSLMMAQ